jgi:hypothetical protein
MTGVFEATAIGNDGIFLETWTNSEMPYAQTAASAILLIKLRGAREQSMGRVLRTMDRDATSEGMHS